MKVSEDYLQSEYSATNTTFIAYGTDLTPTTLTNEPEKVHYFEKMENKKRKNITL